MSKLSRHKHALLHDGTFIPAHPLALDSHRQLDEFRQRRLTRYYMASGTGGIAVGVHSTQFAIRDPQIGLLEPVLSLAADEVKKAGVASTYLLIAGLCGPTEQAVKEAELALKYGYDMGLLSMGGLQGWTEEQILDRTRAVAQVIPVLGFYLQPSVGGRIFSYGFWKEFAEIPGVEAIKAAPFNRYQTLDVVRAVAHSNRRDDVALYTGNDDNIVADLLTTYTFDVDGGQVRKGFVGGLLGHWAVWTQASIRLLAAIKAAKKSGSIDYDHFLAINAKVTDMNAAIFDPAHHFHGCIPGIHEVLRRQGLLEGIWCLDENEALSPGQADEISRVARAYPELTDDDFVRDFLATDQVS
ncbi:dihydrodipicolinate synthase family protein [Parapedobacter sp. 10938]|uniref:dihydrodipicolinate synthase family protein n=1 Tax=Parapedobacter flavus TaxID=3110225 RepID=UPI002DB8CF14|nr:dihydrodipicolinate synthase family protein [Parapedobacter sp. 10938]MEC3878316.1 dihydrodipicolinate synthase family protein [Parapedobacter sp. 10938]